MSNKLKKVTGEKLLYKDRHGTFYLRKRGLDVDTDVCLETKKVLKAQNIRDAYLNARLAGKLGLAFNPNKKAATSTEILDAYVEAGYPGDDAEEREEGQHMDTEVAAVPLLKEFFKSTPAQGYLVGRHLADALPKNLIKVRATRQPMGCFLAGRVLGCPPLTGISAFGLTKPARSGVRALPATGTQQLRAG